MAGTAPTISSVSIGYPGSQTSLHPGQSATLTVVAADADASSVVLSVVVTDADGNASAPTPVTIVRSDALTYAATVTSGGGTVSGGGSSNVLTYTAP